jgi:hypothetical protein
MEHLTLPGDACFTSSEGKKLTESINKLGVKVESIRGVWMHYTHLRQSDPDFVKVSLIFCTHSISGAFSEDNRCFSYEINESYISWASDYPWNVHVSRLFGTLV